MTSTINVEQFLALTDLKSQYFQHVDHRCWAPLRALFIDDARFEGFAFGAQGPDDFVATLTDFFADVHSQHQGFMPQFRSLGEDRIRGRWLMEDYLTWPPDSRTYKGISIPGQYGIRGYGQYEDEYVRTDRGWCIAFTRLVRTRIDPLVGPVPPRPDYVLTPPAFDWLHP